MPKPAKLISNARVLTFGADGRDLPRADILVEGDRIAAIGPDIEAPPGVARIDASGYLAMPGLINAHLHSPGNLMKGMLDGLPLEVFMLYEVPPLAKSAAAGRLAYVRTLLGAVEMLKQGVTAVMDDAFHVPIATVEGVDAICAAYRDIGMRARVAIDQPNVVEYEKYPFLADLLPPALKRDMEVSPRQSDAELLALYDHLIRTWEGAGDGRIRAALSCSAPQRVTVPYLQSLAALSAEQKLPFNMHILETKLQRVLGEEKYGRSLVRYTHDQGALGPQAVVIHAIWVDGADIDLLAHSGAVIAHNPVCNLRLGSGVAPFRQWRNAGIPVCIGTDEAVADDSLSLWGALKMTGLVHTLADPDWTSWPTASEVLDVAMAGGARALALADEIGALVPGVAADLVLIDLDTLPFTPLNDLKRQLIYSENGSSVRHVMVAGQWVVRDGRVLTLDEAALRAEARALMGDYGRETALTRASAARLEPFYRDTVLRAHACNVGLRRRLDA
jgi:5-methylthioadenosine/S-adenosylhomocysteine deaminase